VSSHILHLKKKKINKILLSLKKIMSNKPSKKYGWHGNEMKAVKSFSPSPSWTKNKILIKNDMNFNAKTDFVILPEIWAQFANNFLIKNKIDCEIHNINGSVEIAPNIGLSDAICDIVSTGNTIYKNNLKEILTISNSEAVLCNSDSFDLSKKQILDKLIFRFNSVLRAKRSKYILMNVPNDKIKTVSSLLPVLKSPTILPLEMDGWSSLHTVIDDDKFWDVIDNLKANGAESILVCPIEKMVL
jgi:ATP phosphoribosyltransferase